MVFLADVSTSLETARPTVLHLEEAVVAVGQAVRATDGFVGLGADAVTAGELYSFEAVLQGHFIHVTSAIFGLHITFVGVHLVIRAAHDDLVLLAVSDALLGRLAVVEGHWNHLLSTGAADHIALGGVGVAVRATDGELLFVALRALTVFGVVEVRAIAVVGQLHALFAGGFVQVAVVDVGAAVRAADRVQGEGTADAVAGVDLLLALLDLHGVHSPGPAQSTVESLQIALAVVDLPVRAAHGLQGRALAADGAPAPGGALLGPAEHHRDLENMLPTVSDFHLTFAVVDATVGATHWFVREGTDIFAHEGRLAVDVVGGNHVLPTRAEVHVTCGVVNVAVGAADGFGISLVFTSLRAFGGEGCGGHARSVVREPCA